MGDVDDPGAGATDGRSPDRTEPRAFWIGPAATALLILIVVVSAIVGALSALSARDATDTVDRDRRILQVASEMAVNLVTLKQDSADSDLTRVIDGTTGAFREQFVSAADGFGALLTEGGVESTGEVKLAGIVEASDESATVLAAVTSRVKNNEAPDGEVRVYRMKINLENVDGEWLVSNVGFVA
ncbi:hypothetical protein A3K89_17190 [Rhodococcoides kyotonense]|uniref:Mce-associated membrane protein n=1 Tax=Rhodococcoides kyotonense TaxID=398843 RepID=A0A177YKX9_9NOCA|nr:hypothetical protein A3K89_17190 [Rhodococcus kyotonensis]